MVTFSCTGHLSPGASRQCRDGHVTPAQSKVPSRGEAGLGAASFIRAVSAASLPRAVSVSMVFTAHPSLTCVPALLPKSYLDFFSEIMTGSMQSGEGSPQVSKQSCQTQRVSTAESCRQQRASSGEQAAVTPSTDLAVVSTHRRRLLLHTCRTLIRKMPARSYSQQLSPQPQPTTEPKRTGNRRPTKTSGDRRPT